MENFSIFDILTEADGDEQSSPAPDSQENMAAEPSENSDFNLDTDLDDDSSTSGGDDDLEAPDISSDSGSDDSSSSPSIDSGDSSGDGDEDAVEANTDIFFALSQEEQQIKIKELKGLYASLYNSCNDIIERLNDIDAGDDNINTLARISNQVSNLKLYISDYLTLTFPTKSFVENDIMFNRFLDIVNSITSSIELIAKKTLKNNDD